MKALSLWFLFVYFLVVSPQIGASTCDALFKGKVAEGDIVARPTSLSETFKESLQFGFLERWGINDAWYSRLFEPLSKELGISLEEKMSYTQANRFKNASLDKILGVDWLKLEDLSSSNEMAARFKAFVGSLYKYSTLAQGDGTQSSNLYWSIKKRLHRTGSTQVGYGLNQHYENTYDIASFNFRGIEIKEIDFVLHPRKKAVVRLWVSESSHNELVSLAKDKNFKPEKMIQRLLKKSMRNSSRTVVDLLAGQYIHYTEVPMGDLPLLLFQMFESGARIDKAYTRESELTSIPLRF